jgi:hypothetical protein
LESADLASANADNATMSVSAATFLLIGGIHSPASKLGPENWTSKPAECYASRPIKTNSQKQTADAVTAPAVRIKESKSI